MQQTFEIALKSFGDLRHEEKSRAWIFQIARNECLRILKTSRSTELSEEQPDESIPTPLDLTINSNIRRDDATGPAMVADMVVRGFAVDRGGHWHLAVSFLVLLLGIILFARAGVWVLVATMAGCAIGLSIIDGLVFREYLYVANLIYPAFCAGLSAVILPLVKIATAAPEQLVDGAGNTVK